MKLDAEIARNLAWGFDVVDLGLAVEADTHIEDRRWVSVHELVIRDADGRYWMTYYEQGLTEYQDTRPFEDDTEVEFREVEKVPVTTYEYRRIDRAQAG